MPWFEVEKFSALSQAHAEEAPWKRWPLEMAKVRAIRRLCKRLPMSAEAQAVLTRDDLREARRLSPQLPSEDPVSAINATIREAARETAVSRLPAPDAPAATGNDEGSQAAEVSRASRGTRAKPPLAFTFAQVAERLNQAKDHAALTAASKLIDTLADPQQRDELHEMAARIDADLSASPLDGIA